MKQFIFCLFLAITLQSCSSDDDNVPNPISLTFAFSHVWEDTPINGDDFNQLKFTNQSGELLSIERLRYLVSDVTLTHQSGAVIELNDYQLIDLEDSNSFQFVTSDSIPEGKYTQISFRFGFEDEDNIDGAYPDLNTANFNVPSQLGGGYHFMQFDGTYINTDNNEAPFNYHAIRAVNNADPNNPVFSDTSIQFNLGDAIIVSGSRVSMQVDISEWFKNPNTWDLNTLNTSLMPNFDAQIKMNQNGSSVFSLLEITP